MNTKWSFLEAVYHTFPAKALEKVYTCFPHSANFHSLFEPLGFWFSLSLLTKDALIVKSRNHFSLLTFPALLLSVHNPLSLDFIPIP